MTDSNYVKEVINNEIFYMSPRTVSHVRVIRRLALKFDKYFEANNLNCEALCEGLNVQFKSSKNRVVPDINIICDFENNNEAYYKGIPELIIEVLSPSTVKRDRGDKLKLYEKNGVKEYWIASIADKSIEQRILKDGKYELINVVSIIGENEFELLTDEQKKDYTTIIKPMNFEGLEIDLIDIFKGIIY